MLQRTSLCPVPRVTTPTQASLGLPRVAAPAQANLGLPRVAAPTRTNLGLYAGQRHLLPLGTAGLWGELGPLAPCKGKWSELSGLPCREWSWEGDPSQGPSTASFKWYLATSPREGEEGAIIALLGCEPLRAFKGKRESLSLLSATLCRARAAHLPPGNIPAVAGQRWPWACFLQDHCRGGGELQGMQWVCWEWGAAGLTSSCCPGLATLFLGP